MPSDNLRSRWRGRVRLRKKLPEAERLTEPRGLGTICGNRIRRRSLPPPQFHTVSKLTPPLGRRAPEPTRRKRALSDRNHVQVMDRCVIAEVGGHQKVKTCGLGSRYECAISTPLPSAFNRFDDGARASLDRTGERWLPTCFSLYACVSEQRLARLQVGLAKGIEQVAGQKLGAARELGGGGRILGLGLICLAEEGADSIGGVRLVAGKGSAGELAESLASELSALLIGAEELGLLLRREDFAE